MNSSTTQLDEISFPVHFDSFLSYNIFAGQGLFTCWKPSDVSCKENNLNVCLQVCDAYQSVDLGKRLTIGVDKAEDEVFEIQVRFV